MSLREVARRAGVSHTAAAHHFGDKAGLLTALAAEGHGLLAESLLAAWPSGFLEVGVAYVRFAVTHPAHFEVMFQPRLLRVDDPALVAARKASRDALYGTADGQPVVRDVEAVQRGVAAWAIVHGVATLWLNGVLPPELGDDPEAIARTIAMQLRVPSRRSRAAR